MLGAMLRDRWRSPRSEVVDRAMLAKRGHVRSCVGSRCLEQFALLGRLARVVLGIHP